MEAIITILVFLFFIAISFCIMLIPSFVLICAYDHIAAQVNWHVLELGWTNVICVAVLLVIARSIFKKK